MLQSGVEEEFEDLFQRRMKTRSEPVETSEGNSAWVVKAEFSTGYRKSGNLCPCSYGDRCFPSFNCKAMKSMRNRQKRGAIPRGVLLLQIVTSPEDGCVFLVGGCD